MIIQKNNIKIITIKMKKGRPKKSNNLKMISFNIESSYLEMLDTYCIENKVDRTYIINDIIINFIKNK